VSQADLDAAAATQAAIEAGEQAQADAVEYRAALGVILKLAQAVPSIAPGDTLEAVTEKSMTAAAAARAAGNLVGAGGVSDLAVASLAALGELRPHGVTGARLWAAVAALDERLKETEEL
jgi:hypothetical protein